MSAEEKVIDIIVEQLSVDKDKVVPGASFVDDLGADSLDLVELIMAMEEAFGIEIPDEVAEKINSVKDAIDHVQQVSQEFLWGKRLRTFIARAQQVLFVLRIFHAFVPGDLQNYRYILIGENGETQGSSDRDRSGNPTWDRN